jgi:cell division protein FtsZ
MKKKNAKTLSKAQSSSKKKTTTRTSAKSVKKNKRIKVKGNKSGSSNKSKKSNTKSATHKKTIVPKKALKKKTIQKKTSVGNNVSGIKKMSKKKTSTKTPRLSMSSKQHKGNITRIKVVGVGGCGGNVATRLYEEFPRGVEVVVVNTDTQDLAHNRAHKKLYIGKQTTKGLGAGMDPELGRQAAEENREEIAAALEGSDMVFVAAGFGGGTGSGAAPVVAEIAKELGILCIGVVTKPFSFEGAQREQIAHDAIERLKDRVDTYIIINNDNIFSIIDRRTSLVKAFSIIDNILKNAVVGMAELILSPGIINVDFADIKSIMQHSGPAIIGVGTGNGKERALAAANAALNSPLLETSIEGAKGVLFSVSGRKDVGMAEVNEVARAISENVDSTARIIFGTYYDRKVNKGQVKVTVIATGFGSSYGKNYSLFSDFETEPKHAIISPDTPAQELPEEDHDHPNEIEPSQSSAQELFEDGYEEEDESFWDVPTFLRRKGKKK